MDVIQVYIITRNRPETLVVTVQSVLNQTYPYIDLTISDNSTNNQTYNALKPYMNKIRYIKRNPGYSSGIDHINAILKEASSKFFMIFHDDDEMLPTMVESLYNAIITNPQNAAVGSNAYIIKGGRKHLSFKDGDSINIGVDGLINRYNGKGIAPFPSYMYNKDMISGLYLNLSHGHKYCDVAFLADVAARGNIPYVSKPLMLYNIHSEQDSQSLDYIGHVKLTNYLLKNINDKSLVEGLRLFHIYHNATDGFRERKLKYSPMIMKLLFVRSRWHLWIKYLIRLIQNHFYV